jgi:type IV secretory pathway TraG/TraD family ATPase VirD4
MDSEPGKAAYKHRLLMLLDEFPSLGRLSFFESTLAFSAGYGIKCFLICQSLNQLDKAYGRDNSIVDNCHVRMAYAANRSETAKTISELIGQTTAAKMQRSMSGKGVLGSRSVSESEQEFARQLLTPDEILRLPFEEAILMVGGMPAYRGRKIMYYLDDRFSGRTGPRLRPPESSEEQRAELLDRPPSVWETVAPIIRAGGLEAKSVGAATASSTVVTAGDPQPEEAGATLDAGWARFFGALEEVHEPEVATPNGGDGDPPKRSGSLPL